MKIAILLLNNNGDILYATPIARQIKEHDFPDAHITWIVSQQCSDILKNNKFIDDFEIVDLGNINEIYNGKWPIIENTYKQKYKRGDYDKLFILQPYDYNFLKYKKGIRNMILDSYPIPVKVSLRPIIYLSDREINNVAEFIKKNNIDKFDNRIIFEFAPGSGQSIISAPEAQAIAEQIVEDNSSTCIILASKIALEISNKNIFNAQGLTFKENAELINHCTLLLGCSSGITWLSTSEYCKPLPTVQFLNSHAPWFNSLKADFEINHFDTSNIIELYDFDRELIIKTVSYALQNKFDKAKKEYDQKLKKKYLANNFYTISQYFFASKSYKRSFVFFFKNISVGYRFIMYNLRMFFSLCLKNISL